MDQDKQKAENERAAFETWWPGGGFTKFRDTARAAFQAGAEWKARAALASKPVQGGEALKFTGVDDTQQMHRVRMLLESHGLHMGSKFIASLVEAAQPVREPMSVESFDVIRGNLLAQGYSGRGMEWAVKEATERHHGITKE